MNKRYHVLLFVIIFFRINHNYLIFSSFSFCSYFQYSHTNKIQLKIQKSQQGKYKEKYHELPWQDSFYGTENDLAIS